MLLTLGKFVSLPLTTELRQLLHKRDLFPSVHSPVVKFRLVLTNSCFMKHKKITLASLSSLPSYIIVSAEYSYIYY